MKYDQRMQGRDVGMEGGGEWIAHSKLCKKFHVIRV